MAVGTRSQAREAYFRYRTAFDIARHQRDVAVQLSTAMQEETQNRYNGMLQSTWDLLASARARVQSINSAQQAQRDFWLAHTDLQLVLAGGVATFSAETPDSGASATTPKGH
jgi:outer membrane protein TolC